MVTASGSPHRSWRPGCAAVGDGSRRAERPAAVTTKAHAAVDAAGRPLAVLRWVPPTVRPCGHRGRNVVERAFGRLKEWRGIALPCTARRTRIASVSNAGASLFYDESAPRAGTNHPGEPFSYEASVPSQASAAPASFAPA